MWVAGELVHLEDLVLHDARMDIRAPSHELVIAHGIVRARRRVSRNYPGWAVSRSGIMALAGISEEAGGEVEQIDRGGERPMVEVDEDDALAPELRRSMRSSPVPNGCSMAERSRAKEREQESVWRAGHSRPGWDEASGSRVARSCQKVDRLPVTLRRSIWDAWSTSNPAAPALAWSGARFGLLEITWKNPISLLTLPSGYGKFPERRRARDGRQG